jgi:hypothetical protein
VKKPTPDEARKVIFKCLDRSDRPLLIGQATLALGPLWTLSETEGVLGKLVEEGILRELTPEERWKWDLAHGYVRCKKP